MRMDVRSSSTSSGQGTGGIFAEAMSEASARGLSAALGLCGLSAFADAVDVHHLGLRASFLDPRAQRARGDLQRFGEHRLSGIVDEAHDDAGVLDVDVLTVVVEDGVGQPADIA